MEHSEPVLWKPTEVDLPLVGKCCIYLPKCTDESVEAEWSLKDVTAWIWKSADPDKRVGRWKAHQKKVENLYTFMFHEDPPPARQCVTQRDKDTTKTMMYEKTIPTRMVFALVVSVLQNLFIEEECRKKAGDIFHHLLDKICKIPGVIKFLEVPRLGSIDHVKLQSNMFSSSNIWSSEACKCFGPLWHRAALRGERSWLNTTPNNMTVAAFTMFCIDVRFTETASCLLAAGISLVSQLANLCRGDVLESLVEEVSLKRSHIVGQTVRLRQGFRVSACYEACQMIAEGKVLWLQKKCISKWADRVSLVPVSC